MIYDNVEDKSRISKSVLFVMENEVNISLDNILNNEVKDETYLEYENLVENTSKKPTEKNVISAMKKSKYKIVRDLYECKYCTDAKFRISINAKSGEEMEYLTGLCGNEICKYKEEFKRISEKNDSDRDIIDKILKSMLAD